MIPETQSETNPGTRPRLRMKWDNFVRLSAALGCETDVARARLFDLDNKTIHNLKNGGPASDKTVAKVLAVAQQSADWPVLKASGPTPEFDSYFEVILDAA